MTIRTRRMLAEDRTPRPLTPVANRLAFDRASDRTMDEEGRMFVKNVKLTLATVNDYYGWEIPGWEELGLVKNRKYAMLRDPDALKLAAESGDFDGIPLLDEHLEHNADDPPKENVAGAVSAGCTFDGEFILTPLLSVWNKDDIQLIDSEEKCELSCSYAYDPVMEPGNFKGLRYDGRMVNIKPNHVALVDKGRAGPDVRVNDRLPGGLTMKKAAFGRFVKKANKLFANDADIEASELVELIDTVAQAAAASADPDGADDDDMNDDPNAMDADETDEEKEKRMKKEADEKKAAEDAARDADPDAEKEKAKANDRARQRARADDAATIRADVMREMTAWARAVEKVEPFLGRVRLAMDSVEGGADTLYRRALDSAGVKHKGLSGLALERMVDMLPEPVDADVRFANDADPAGAKSALDGILPARNSIIRS